MFLHQDKKYLESLISQISEFLDTHLNLTLHPDKLFVKTFTLGVDFLGWIHFSNHSVLRTATKKRMFLKVSRNPNNESVVASYKGMLSHGNGYKLVKKIDIKIPTCALTDGGMAQFGILR